MRDLLSFQHCRHPSFLSNNPILFPAVPPEREQETLPLPNAAEPEWPRVLFGNTDDALFRFQSRTFVGSLFLPASARPLGRERGLRAAALVIGCMLACLEPR